MENDGDIRTLDTNPYQSESVPYLRLIDTRGIELRFIINNVNFVADEVHQFIIKKNP